MAGIRIKDAKIVSQLKDDDNLPISDGSLDAKRTSIGQMKTYITKDVNAKLDEAITSELYVPPTQPLP